MTTRISVIIVAMNEAHDIGDCIESVKNWVDEIVVFDSGSTDGTQDICRRYGVRLFETDWPGDGPQKNRALGQATGDWVLCLDADERVSTELRDEILAVLRAGSTHVAFSCPRRSSFCGQFMRHSGWWPDRVVRFFLRSKGNFSDLRTHCSLQLQGSVGRFGSPIIHLSIANLDEVLDKANVYSGQGALTLLEKGRRSSVSKAVFKGIWSFFRTYVLRLGFLDGKLGFVLAASNAHETFYRYIKLWLLQRAARE